MSRLVTVMRESPERARDSTIGLDFRRKSRWVSKIGNIGTSIHMERAPVPALKK
jgi:hypothetical protein